MLYHASSMLQDANTVLYDPSTALYRAGTVLWDASSMFLQTGCGRGRQKAPVKTLTVYGLHGRTIFVTQPAAMNFTVVLPAGIANGTYFVECNGASGKYRQKVVVKR